MSSKADAAYIAQNSLNAILNVLTPLAQPLDIGKIDVSHFREPVDEKIKDLKRLERLIASAMINTIEHIELENFNIAGTFADYAAAGLNYFFKNIGENPKKCTQLQCYKFVALNSILGDLKEGYLSLPQNGF